MEIPLAEPEQSVRRVPIAGSMTIHVPAVNGDPADAAAAAAASEASLPEALPVLPLRDSVPFPDTMLPLAVGQERSIKLLDDVLGGNRMLVMVAAQGARGRGARAGRRSTAWASRGWWRG